MYKSVNKFKFQGSNEMANTNMPILFTLEIDPNHNATSFNSIDHNISHRLVASASVNLFSENKLGSIQREITLAPTLKEIFSGRGWSSVSALKGTNYNYNKAITVTPNPIKLNLIK